VVDFLYFKLINFAIFNVADAFVCVGAGLMILAILLETAEEVKRSKKS
jgi:signal peptidase II